MIVHKKEEEGIFIILLHVLRDSEIQNQKKPSPSRTECRCFTTCATTTANTFQVTLWLNRRIVDQANGMTGDLVLAESWFSKYRFFVVPARHLADQDGLDQHFQASVHYPLTSGINKSQEYQNKTFVNAENQTLGRCVRTKNATSVPCSPTASANNV